MQCCDWPEGVAVDRQIVPLIRDPLPLRCGHVSHGRESMETERRQGSNFTPAFLRITYVSLILPLPLSHY